MNRQMTYDMVRDHLMNQGSRSYRSGYDVKPSLMGCAYRDDDGRACAIGCLIPDELYRTSLEGKLVTGLPSKVLDAIGATKESDISFLSGLQKVHDDSRDGDFAESLYDFAIANGLRP